MSASLKASLFELAAAHDGASKDDIDKAILTGMAPQDIMELRGFTRDERLLMVIRCPKQAAVHYHGFYPAKTWATSVKKIDGKSVKSGPDGLARVPGKTPQVSDYDLMCVYRLVGPGRYAKIFFSGTSTTDPQSAMTQEATLLVRKINKHLKSRFQHGAQDDLDPTDMKYRRGERKGEQVTHPGVPDEARFAVFDVGRASYLGSPAEAKAFYKRNGLRWPYQPDGMFDRTL